MTEPDKGSILDSYKSKVGPLPVWGWVLIVGVFGYLYYRKRKAAAAAAAANDQTQVGTSFDPTLANAMDAGLQEQLNNVGAGLATVGSNLGSATTALNNNTAAVTKDTTADQVPKSTTTKARGTFIVPGKLDQHVPTRTVAQYLTPTNMREQPNAVEAMLKRLVTVNPQIRGRTWVPAGHKLVDPR